MGNGFKNKDTVEQEKSEQLDRYNEERRIAGEKPLEPPKKKESY